MLDYTHGGLNAELNIWAIPLHKLVMQVIDQVDIQGRPEIPISHQLTPVTILADGALVERAVSNLLSNALKYSTSTIHISIAQQQHWITISVTDDGPGIAEHQQERIFQAFCQGQTASSKEDPKVPASVWRW